jgi:hypothetical protein
MVLIGAGGDEQQDEHPADTVAPPPAGPEDTAQAEETDRPADTDRPEDAAPKGRSGRFGVVRRHSRVLAAVAVVVLLGLIAAAFFLGRGTTSPSTKKAGAKGGLPAGFITYHNAADGFSISYPGTWKQVADPAASLLVSAGGDDAVLIRVQQLQSAVNTNNVNDVKAFTDSVLSSPGAKLTVLGSRPITVAGIKGYYYLYTIASGQDLAVHAHYFLFQGRKLITMVFQGLPYNDFIKLAPTFDQISGSLKSNPKILGPIPPATTAPSTIAPGTTAPGTTAPGTTAPATTVPGTTAP